MVVGQEGRLEEGKAVDVIPVGVGQEDGGFAQLVTQIEVAELADAGAGIQDNVMVTGDDLETTRIAAELDVPWGWTRDATAYAPKGNFERHVQ